MTQRRELSKGTQTLLGALGLFSLFAIVQFLLQSGIVNIGSLPLPTTVLSRLFELLGDGEFWSQIFVSLRGAAIGLILGIFVGVFLGSLLGSVGWARTYLQPALEVIRPLPGIAIAPLLIAVFGRGMVSRSLTVALACAWPVLFNTEYGFAGVSATARQTARAFGESTAGIIRRVSLPWASPFIFTGIRLSASLALIVEIAVEILITDGTGLGGFIIEKSFSGNDLPAVYAATVMAGILSLIVNFGLRYLDNRWFGWRQGLEA